MDRGKRRTALAAALAATAATGASGAAAADCRAEIIEHVIDPCLLQGARDHGLDKKLGEDKAVEVLRFVHAAKAEILISAMMPTVEGKGEAARRAEYAVLLSECIENMRSGY